MLSRRIGRPVPGRDDDVLDDATCDQPVEYVHFLGEQRLLDAIRVNELANGFISALGRCKLPHHADSDICDQSRVNRITEVDDADYPRLIIGGDEDVAGIEVVVYELTAQVDEARRNTRGEVRHEFPQEFDI